MTNTMNERDAYPVTAPRDAEGKPIEPAPYFHEWDDTPHAIFPLVGMNAVALGDVVLGGTHQVEGIGRAEQRGAPAVRLDLQFLAAPTIEPSARLILPVDHAVEVKRYFPDALGRYRYAWIKLDSEEHQYPATLIPDYGPNVDMCCSIKNPVAGIGDQLNPHGFDLSQTMCDECADSWDTDYDVVRS